MSETYDWRKYADKRLAELLARSRFLGRKRVLDSVKTPKHLLLFKILYEVSEMLYEEGVVGYYQLVYYNIARMVFKRVWLTGLDKIYDIYEYVKSSREWAKNCDDRIAHKIIEIIKRELERKIEIDEASRR